MPISDQPEYERGHFNRVYEHLIKPACIEAGFETIRADDVKHTNVIIVDILKRILEADLVVCDLSARNPNVLYELGIRQAFDLPVVLIKDKQTERIFDIQGIRTLEYDESLRIDLIEKDKVPLQNALTETLAKHEKDSSSLIRLLNIKKAELGPATEVSQDASVILDAVNSVLQRVKSVENYQRLKAVRESFQETPTNTPAMIGSAVKTLAKDQPLGDIFLKDLQLLSQK